MGRALQLVALAVGIVFAWCAAILVVFWAMSLLYGGGPRAPRWLFPLSLSIGLAAGTLGWIWLLNRVHYRQIAKLARPRQLRLRPLVEHPDAPRRLPHRLLEYTAITLGSIHWRLRSVLPSVRPGMVIFACMHGHRAFSDVVPIDLPFEPAAIDRAGHELYALQYSTDGEGRAEEAGALESPQGPVQRRAARSIGF